MPSCCTGSTERQEPGRAAQGPNQSPVVLETGAQLGGLPTAARPPCKKTRGNARGPALLALAESRVQNPHESNLDQVPGRYECPTHHGGLCWCRDKDRLLSPPTIGAQGP